MAAIEIGGYPFNGPYMLTNSIEDSSGVYVVLCQIGNNYYPIDVGESAHVRSRLDTMIERIAGEETVKGH